MSEKATSLSDAIDAAVAKKRATKPDVSLDEAIAAAIAQKTTSQDKPAEPAKSEPSAGYWEDRGIAGKVWHPASGVSERNRSDNQVLGLPPEMAALSTGAVVRSVVAPGLSAAGRVAAGATAAAGQAAPIIKYEVVRHGLKAVGVPEPFASIGAGVVTARTSGGKGAAAEAPAAEAAAETTPMGFPKTEPPLSPLEFSRKLKAEHQARNIPPFSPPAESTVAQEFKALGQKVAEATKQSGKPHYTAGETSLALKLIQRGLTAEQATKLIDLRKGMPQAWKMLPTDEEVEAIVKSANQSGRMTR